MIKLVFIGCIIALANANFLKDPKCPAARAQGSCAGRRSTCWSPGVRDTDCPGHGLCCFDGCANTCVGQQNSSPSIQTPVAKPPPKKHGYPQPPPVNNYVPPVPKPHHPPPVHTPAPYVPPPAPYVPPPPPVQAPSQDYGVPVQHYPPIAPKEEYGPPPVAPPVNYGPPPVAPVIDYGPPVASPQVHIPVVHIPVQPVAVPIQTPGSCPNVIPIPLEQCYGAHSTCWSVGVADIDCPNWGLCCFDGCANTCLGSAPPPPPPQPQYEPPRNPCDPNPCGDGSMCIPNEGKPTCKCPEGLVPDPTPEIRCSVRDPCNPSPCGPGTTCTPNADGNPICRCLPGLIPKPDTITGCGPECVVDPDCRYGYVCANQKCVEKPDPCNPSPCGPGTTCTPNRNGNPICKCLPGLIPKPDTITGCGPECIVDPDCQYGYICRDQKCVEKPDPCNPNPCGEGAACTPQGDSFTCACPPGTVGDARTGCIRGECQVDDDCSLQTACQDYHCIDPCLTGTCSSTDFCRVMNHIPICGFNYEPTTPAPKDAFVIGERYNPGRRPEPVDKTVIGSRHDPIRDPAPRNPFVIGGTEVENNNQIQRCQGTRCGGVDQMMMMMMDTSNLPVIGAAFNRRKRRIMRARRRRVAKKLN